MERAGVRPNHKPNHTTNKPHHAPQMSQIYLIDNTTLQSYEDISVNVKPERVQLFVRKAQDLDLKPFLGYALYYDFIKNFNDDGTLKDDAPQPYVDLFNGSEYLDQYGYVVCYQGLRPVLAYFTFARFIEADAVHYTSTGPIVKHHDNGDPLPPAEVVKLVQQQRSVANAYANEVEKFLRDNREDFPLWSYNEKNRSSRQSGPRIRAVDKTIFNLPGEFDNYDNYYPLTEFLN